MITERINIDVRPGGVPVVIHVTQYEAGLREFVFTPYTSAGELTAVAGSATLEGTKPDGYAFQQACEMIDGVITYTLQEQLCAVPGRVWSRLVIRDINDGMIGYTAIVWVVGCAGVKDDAVMSDSDISALRQFLDEFGTIDAYRGALNGALAAVGSPLVAATASAMTDTTKVYVYTGSESGYTEGHWYYWNGSAWTDGGVYQSTGINTDITLTVEGMAADAKATGDAVAELKNDLDENVSDLKSAVNNFTTTIIDRTVTDSTEVEIPVSIPIGYVGKMEYKIENHGASSGWFQLYARNQNDGQVFGLSQMLNAGANLEGTITPTGTTDIAKITIKSVNGRVSRFWVGMVYLPAITDAIVSAHRSVFVGQGLGSITEQYGYGNSIKIDVLSTSTRVFAIEPRYSSDEKLDIYADSTEISVPHNSFVYANLSTGKVEVSVSAINDNSHVLLFKNYLGVMQGGVSSYLRAKTSADLSADVSDIAEEIASFKAPGYLYQGERIQIAPQLKYKNIATFTRGYRQGAACYNNLIFQFHSQNQVEDGNFHGCTIYDINAGAEIQFIDLGYNELLHNNNASFGTQKYDDADPFPLLYVSQENANARYVLVYRITETGTASAPYSMTVVQTITAPPMSEWSVVYPNACVGNDGYLYIVGWRSVETKYEIIKYEMPTGNVTLAYADRIKSVEWPVLTNGQGFIVYDNKLYYSCGGNSNSNMQVIDLFDENIVTTIHFNDCELPYEPEGVFLHNGKLCVSFVTYGVAEFTF